MWPLEAATYPLINIHSMVVLLDDWIEDDSNPSYMYLSQQRRVIGRLEIPSENSARKIPAKPGYIDH